MGRAVGIWHAKKAFHHEEPLFYDSQGNYMLSFYSDSILIRIKQGERDADNLLKKLARFSLSKSSMEAASKNLREKINNVDISLESKNLEDAIRRLEKGG